MAPYLKSCKSSLEKVILRKIRSLNYKAFLEVSVTFHTSYMAFIGIFPILQGTTHIGPSYTVKKLRGPHTQSKNLTDKFRETPTY